MDRVRKHFLDKVGKGVILNHKQLTDYVKKNKIVLSHKEEGGLRKYRRMWKSMAVFSRANKVKHFASMAYPKMGTVQLDVGFFHPRLKGHNGGNIGFLLAVEMVSQKLAVVPIKNATGDSWKRAIQKIIEESYVDINLFLTDRDTVVKPDFVKYIFDRYRVRWQHLIYRSKAAMCENMIEYCKRHLSMAMAMNKTKNWIQYVPEIVSSYNQGFITGTKIPRNRLHEANFLSKLKALYKVRDPTLFFNGFDLGRFTPKMERKLFRFRTGDTVLLQRKLDLGVKTSQFDKTSVKGKFSKTLYTVVERKLKHNSKFTLVPAYRVAYKRTGELVPGFFYSDEILQANQIEKADDDEDDA